MFFDWFLNSSQNAKHMFLAKTIATLAKEIEGHIFGNVWKEIEGLISEKFV